MAAELKDIFRRVGDLRVLVIGDIVLDQFIWGSVRRISPEAPVPVVEVTKESLHLGGAANVVNNIIALGAQAVMCGIIGNDAAGESVLEFLRGAGAGKEGIFIASERPTSLKTRIIAQHQQVVRVDREIRDGIPAPLRKEILGYLARAVAGADAVIISDYGKGMITRPVVEAILRGTRRRKVIVSVDPKPDNMPHYRGVSMITPNVAEAQGAVGFPLVTDADLDRGAAAMRKMLSCPLVVITRGEKGMSLYRKGTGPVHMPTAAQEVFDVTGAGDTVIATLTACLAAGADLRTAASVANHAAGIVVGKLGTATATREEILAAMRPRS